MTRVKRIHRQRPIVDDRMRMIQQGMQDVGQVLRLQGTEFLAGQPAIERVLRPIARIADQPLHDRLFVQFVVGPRFQQPVLQRHQRHRVRETLAHDLLEHRYRTAKILLQPGNAIVVVSVVAFTLKLHAIE